MPYISRNNDRREKLRNGEPALTAGELNYQIFYFVKHNYIPFLDRCAGIKNNHKNEEIENFIIQFLGEKPNYQRYNDMTGALIRCYKEIQRRLDIEFNYLLDICDSYDKQIADYEDLKINENGDVE